MKELKETYKMYTGVEIPKVAIGFWQTPKEISARVVEDAIEVGYIHIDDAVAYDNESGVGEGLKKSGIKRENIFITSKIPAECKSYEETKKIFSESLERLGIDYIDLMLIHAPKPWAKMRPDNHDNYDKENVEVWKALTELYKEGKARSIGVSNFSIHDIENILANSEIKPMVNQICVYIGHVPFDVIEYCKSLNILVEAYSPNATGRLKNYKEIVDMANKYNVSPAQLGIKYDLNLGTLPLPKTTHKEFMIENASLDFEISDEDMNILNNIKGL